MKMIIAVALALVAVAVAGPFEPEGNYVVKINEYENKQDENGYAFKLKQSDGTARSEEGTYKEALDADNKPVQSLNVRGSYTYVNPDGKEETVEYYADENGFHAKGDSIPKAR